jgi:hypothetical protein
MKATASACCDECGNDVEIETTAEQCDGYDWYAYEGDIGTCVECGTRHSVCITDDYDGECCGWLARCG